MSKSIAIIQSNYIPWKGYFDMIGLVDEFIIYDEVQYTKNDWRNRNKIKTKIGIQWLTIPVYQKSLDQRISETIISDKKWATKHWNTLITNYSKAPFFKLVSPTLEGFYSQNKSMRLSEVNQELIKLVCNLVGINTKIRSSSDFNLIGDPTEKLVDLCCQTSAQIYLSGPAAKEYLREDLFIKQGIKVKWMDYSGYTEYPQLHPPFEHHVSILDLLFNTGIEAGRYMKFSRK